MLFISIIIHNLNMCNMVSRYFSQKYVKMLSKSRLLPFINHNFIFHKVSFHIFRIFKKQQQAVVCLILYRSILIPANGFVSPIKQLCKTSLAQPILLSDFLDFFRKKKFVSPAVLIICLNQRSRIQLLIEKLGI